MDQNGYRVEVDSVKYHDWTRIVDSFSDSSLYQTWDYEAVHSSETHMSHLLLTQDDTVLGAAQLRIVQVPLLRAGIAYVYFGPMWCRRGRDRDVTVLRALLEAIREEYALRRGLLVRIVFNIREGKGPEIPNLLSSTDYYRQARSRTYRTFDIDLSLPLADLRKSFHQKWRNLLNKAEKGELSVEEGTDRNLFCIFHEIYVDLLARKGFPESVNVVDFMEIQERLPKSQKMRVLIASHEGEPCSGLVLSTVGDAAVYLLGATNENGMKKGSSYLLQWRALKWLKENGFQRYDLGGINSEENPGVYHFKSGLAGKKPQEVSTFGVWETSAGPLSPMVIKCGEAFRKIGRAWTQSR